jgi:hypothetical protein
MTRKTATERQVCVVVGEGLERERRRPREGALKAGRSKELASLAAVSE